MVDDRKMEDLFLTGEVIDESEESAGDSNVDRGIIDESIPDEPDIDPSFEDDFGDVDEYDFDETINEPISNEYLILAKHWQQTGMLDEGVELKADMTEQDLEDLFLGNMQSKLERRIIDKYASKLESKGIDPNEFFARNDDVDAYISQYEQIGKLTYEDLQEKSTNTLESVRHLGEAYYKSKGPDLGETEIKALVDNDLRLGYEEDLFQKYRDYFGDFAKELRVESENRRKADEEKKNQELSQTSEEIKEKIKDMTIGGHKLNENQSKELHDAVFLRNQIYDDGIRRRKVTLFEKLRLESENDVEKQLGLAAYLLFGINDKKIGEISERKGAVSMLDKLAKANIMGITSTPGRKIKKDIDDDIFID